MSLSGHLAKRRERAAAAWDLSGELVLIGAGDEVPIAGHGDQVYPYRPHSDYFYLADRVLVLSARPGRVVKELAAPDPRAADRDGAVTDPAFVATRGAALRALHEGAVAPAVPFAGPAGKRNSGTGER